MPILQGRVYRCDICDDEKVVNPEGSHIPPIFIDPFGWWVEPDDRKKVVCKNCVHKLGKFHQYIIQR
jgi:hypothetical protein